MSIAVSSIGEFGGKRVDEAVLTNSAGVSVALMNWGVTVRDWQVPVENSLRQVVLGFDTFDPYPDHSPYFGSLAGRVANRIAKAQFELDGKIYKLDANEGDYCLHGGIECIGRQVWDMSTDSTANAVRFTLDSPDGHMGFPGNVRFEATYSLNGNRLRLDLSGVPDRPTPISLVQHIYFNLGQTGTVLDHTVHLPHSVARTEAGEGLVMSGVISPVAGTPFDILSPRTLRDASGAPADFDLNFVLTNGRDHAEPIAIVSGEDDALRLRLWSDRPGLQFYNALWTDVAAPGHGGQTYGKYSGLCLEDQMWPDAVNQPHFPNIICTPDAPYKHWCEIEIG